MNTLAISAIDTEQSFAQQNADPRVYLVLLHSLSLTYFPENQHV